ncbi:hypothetical protein [Jannaschia rubra]|uniref:hypothetical protein n=1 Tax=Jannaschia rubra TaxID=282197 RepID=UPI002490FC72|nr:hypothetical protein [Jannaschia rubra]
MTDFRKTYAAGRGIAVVFSNLGWGIAAVGLLLAAAGFVQGVMPGLGGSTDAVDLSARIGASMPGLGVAFFGLFSVMMAQQTRAAMDTADMTHRMLEIAARRAADETASAPKPAMSPQAQPEEAMATVEDDDIPAMPTMARPRSPLAAPRAVSPAPKAEAPTRAEPRIIGPVRPSAPAGTRPHPIFSARPPR